MPEVTPPDEKEKAARLEWSKRQGRANSEPLPRMASKIENLPNAESRSDTHPSQRGGSVAAEGVKGVAGATAMGGVRGVQGAVQGASAGATAGSIVPVVGTVIGGALGAIAGGAAGTAMGAMEGGGSHALRAAKLSFQQNRGGGSSQTASQVAVKTGKKLAGFVVKKLVVTLLMMLVSFIIGFLPYIIIGGITIIVILSIF